MGFRLYSIRLRLFITDTNRIQILYNPQQTEKVLAQRDFQTNYSRYPPSQTHLLVQVIDFGTKLVAMAEYPTRQQQWPLNSYLRFPTHTQLKLENFNTVRSINIQTICQSVQKKGLLYLPIILCSSHRIVIEAHPIEAIIQFQNQVNMAANWFTK